MRQISRNRIRRNTPNAKTLIALERHLERTDWSRGIYTPGRMVPGARPAQLRAGAKKLFDVLMAQARREQKPGVSA